MPAIQQGFVEVGSDCVLSSTFGTCAMMLECQSFADRVAEPSAADPAALYDSTHGLESAILGVLPEGRAQFCFEARRLCQSFGHAFRIALCLHR